MMKLYVVVRADISPGDQIAQACHAVAEFSVHEPARFQEWATAQRNLVVLQAPSRTALDIVRSQLLDEGIGVVTFREPDMADELTAIAFGGEGARFVSQLPLALRDAEAKAKPKAA